jgi:hypothetical protein
MKKMRKQCNIMDTLRYHGTHIVDETSYVQYKRHKLRQMQELHKSLNRKLANYKKYNLKGCEALRDKISGIEIDMDYIQIQPLDDFIKMNEKFRDDVGIKLDTYITKLKDIRDDISELKSIKKKVDDASKMYERCHAKWMKLRHERIALLYDMTKCRDIEFYINEANEKGHVVNTANAIEFVDSCLIKCHWGTV